MIQDIELFLSPINASHRCGADLRYDKAYDEIKQARFSEDATLPQGVWVRTVAEAQWDVVERLCSELLVHQSKDLQVSAWLMEAWYRQYGMRGIIDGLRLLSNLCQRYWDEIHPLSETGLRLSPFHWLNEKFSMQLLSLPLEEKGESNTYTFSDYKKAKMMSERAGAPTLSEVLARIKKMPSAFFRTLVQECQEALNLTAQLEEFVATKIPSDEVSLYRLRQQLSELIELFKSLLPRHAAPKPDLGAALDALETPDSELPPMPLDPHFAHMTLESRHLAYARIHEIADYLEKIEPHSPTPYLLRKAVAWGQMGLQELLEEFVKNGMNLQQMQTWVGMPSPPRAPGKATPGA